MYYYYYVTKHTLHTCCVTSVRRRLGREKQFGKTTWEVGRGSHQPTFKRWGFCDRLKRHALVNLCGPDDITDELQPDTTNATVKSQKAGKFKRTALTFFGVRKSICILPSFFGGRGKNQNKWSSKKGITKSRTHDGLSKGGHDDSLRSGYTSAGDFEYRNQRDYARELHNSCHDECIHPTADQKSLTLSRQKRGLRRLFHSFKHHRNHRNVGLDKSEMVAVSPPHCSKEVSVIQDNTNQNVTECLGSEPDVPDFTNVICDISIGPECSETVAVALKKGVAQESPKSELDDQMCDDQMEEINFVVSSEYEEISRGHSEPCLKLEMMSEPVLKCETPAGSSDQLNLIFGDVASLKSFDSLTGCGDIIADQEDDSITESTVSGERSRNGGKRASCYLTYQGGGEDMASPEDLDGGCLHEFWGNSASEEICCTCNQDHTDLTADLTSTHNMDLVSSNSAHQASGLDTSSSIADVLTPQSEHQESVPNSDEGYYDSTTPGQDEGQEKTDRLRVDRLPRDSYSGDALYELFAPDESLLSPHYENKSKLPVSVCAMRTQWANLLWGQIIVVKELIQHLLEFTFQIHFLLAISLYESMINLSLFARLTVVVNIPCFQKATFTQVMAVLKLLHATKNES
uniref:APC membrane recruitment protein 1 n=1 Tax=Monopterus albus TaxID=43700 RepID=A0A3Q3KM27_MONAL